MGDFVVGTENGIDLEAEVKTGTAEPAEISNRKENSDGAGAAAAAGTSSSSFVRWERFLPNMAMRVLLVEADDSTRQIIGALLKKCSYKVAAVSDGLKAWEVLKERPHSVDLILTEVELPSISGYALLTLIAEHESCKNIPVIMMSSNDSVSTVYKCMLRGASDFLVKPLRKNELRNLWQHVWRKQASSASGPGPPDESLAQQKIEATAESNAVSNHSSGYMACIRRNRECIERGSDAQSSCTKPELEAEGADAKHVDSLSQPKAKCLSDDTNMHKQDEYHQESRKTRVPDNYGTTQRQDKNLDGFRVNVICQNSESNNYNINVPENSCREARDLIGAFDKYPKGTFGSPASNAITNKFDILPLLDLSLRRSHPSCSVNQVNDETRRLNHSDASAFCRYINKPQQPPNYPSPSTSNQQKNHKTNSETQLPNRNPDYNSDQISSHNHIPMSTFSYPQQREISQPIPVKGVRIENAINGFVPLMPRTYRPQPGLPSHLPIPVPANHLQSRPQMHPFYSSDGQTSSSRQFRNDVHIERGQKIENLEDESGNNSSFYEEGLVAHEGASRRSMQREAALNKFRQKRKDRCFEKKVRYESRKKLAEQRPRIKGQFVRQLPNDLQFGSSSAS